MLSDSTNMHEHRFPTINHETGKTKFDNFEPCRVQQDLDIGTRDCILCERWTKKNYPYYVGLFTAMSLTPYWSAKGYEWLFNRYILSARLGSSATPGMLKRLKVLADRNGGTLVGCILECTRQAKKCEIIGDQIDTIKVIPKDRIAEWLQPQMAEFVERVNVSIDDPASKLTVERLLQRDPPKPFDFRRIIKLRTDRELLEMVGLPKEIKGPKWEARAKLVGGAQGSQGSQGSQGHREHQNSQGGHSHQYGGDGPPPHTDDDEYSGGYRGRRANSDSRGTHQNGGGQPKSQQQARLDDDISF